ncbi:class I SAM-dependent methyltransferase [Patescibacteria group bacterium]|nr:class I SAM-dependent methyltransferase [Patescibacteria group bacterium]MBU1951831.1 class I SAM-dependent methyltransferase [Patescibacteria group bacterium]
MNNKKESYEKTESYYNKYGTWYDKERIKGYYEMINKKEIEIVEKYGRDKDILEIGCGTGIILNEVNKFAREANGIDLSPGMLERAKEKGLKVQVANAKSIPFDDNIFDVVYSFKVLAHIPEIKDVIRETARVVKNDGTLVLEFYNPYSMKMLTNWVYNLVKKRDVYIRYDSIGKIKTYLPDNWELVGYHGIKILALGKKLSAGKLFLTLERILASSFMKMFGGYIVVVIKRKNA